MIPQVGFLPAADPRVRGTIEAIERELTVDGLVYRYDTGTRVDGLPPGEGVFLACTFWLADALALLGRREERDADVRARARPRQRRGAPLRAVRPRGAAAGRELPAGVLARVARQLRAGALRRRGRAAALPGRLRGVARGRGVRPSTAPRGGSGAPDAGALHRPDGTVSRRTPGRACAAARRPPASGPPTGTR